MKTTHHHLQKPMAYGATMRKLEIDTTTDTFGLPVKDEKLFIHKVNFQTPPIMGI